MNAFALRSPAREGLPDVRPARIEIFEDMGQAKPYWRSLEDGLGTPYQAYDFLKLWQRHVGSAAGVTPCIVVGFDASGRPLFLWPLGRRRLGPWQVVEFLGGKHANFNMALWCGGTDRIEAADLRAVLARLAACADLVRLCNQPLTWHGSSNPLALLPHQLAADSGFSGALSADFEALLRAHTDSATRRKMRKKTHALAALGAVTFEQAQIPQRIREVLDAFFQQKSERMRTLGIADAFAQASVHRFIEAAATERTPGGELLLELYALSLDDSVLATMGGIIGGDRFCAMFNSIASDSHAVHSPGEQLLLQLVRRCCERGLNRFDLGIGEAHYKNLFCGDAEPLFDSILPLTAKGWLPAQALRLLAAAKRAIKQRPPLWALVRAWRAWRARFTARP